MVMVGSQKSSSHSPLNINVETKKVGFSPGNKSSVDNIAAGSIKINEDSVSFQEEPVKIKKGRRKKPKSCRNDKGNTNFRTVIQERQEPLLLVTRKKQTFKNVPLDPSVYPFDKIQNQVHIRSLVNTKNRQRWQKLIQKDLVNPTRDIK